MRTTDDIDLFRSFWLASEGEVTGPYTLEQISEMWRSGRIYATAQACEVDFDTWFPITDLRRDFPDIMSTGRSVVASTKIAIPPQDFHQVHQGVYRVLALFFGQVGVHHFYAGEIEFGLWKAGLFIVGLVIALSGLGIGFLGWIILIALGLWVLVDVIDGYTPPADRAARYQSKTSAERVAARQPFMYGLFFALLAIILLVLFA